MPRGTCPVGRVCVVDDAASRAATGLPRFPRFGEHPVFIHAASGATRAFRFPATGRRTMATASLRARTSAIPAIACIPTDRLSPVSAQDEHVACTAEPRLDTAPTGV